MSRNEILSSGIVDFEYIVTIMKEIKQEYIEKYFEKRKKGVPFYVKVGRKLPNFILTKLSLYYRPKKHFIIGGYGYSKNEAWIF